MKHLSLIIFLIGINACGGRLSDEQRKEMREQMEAHKIVKVSESEIIDAAYSKGRVLVRLLQDTTKTDSLVNSASGKIRFIEPDQANIHATEKQILDAYLASEGSTLNDNIQMIRNGQENSDSLLYSYPVVLANNQKLNGVWSIWLSRKELILEMKKK